MLLLNIILLLHIQWICSQNSIKTFITKWKTFDSGHITMTMSGIKLTISMQFSASYIFTNILNEHTHLIKVKVTSKMTSLCRNPIFNFCYPPSWSSCLTVVEVHKKFLDTMRFTHNDINFDVTCDVKIDVNMCKPHYVNLFLWTSSIVQLFDYLSFDIFLTIWHLLTFWQIT